MKRGKIIHRRPSLEIVVLVDQDNNCTFVIYCSSPRDSTVEKSSFCEKTLNWARGQVLMACFVVWSCDFWFYSRDPITHQQNWMVQIRAWPSKSELLMGFWLSLLMHLVSSIEHTNQTKMMINNDQKPQISSKLPQYIFCLFPTNRCLVPSF